MVPQEDSSMQFLQNGVQPNRRMVSSPDSTLLHSGRGNQATNERLALQNGNASFGAPKGRIWWETSDQVGGFGLEAGDRPGMNHGRYISLGRRLRDSKFPWD